MAGYPECWSERDGGPCCPVRSQPPLNPQSCLALILGFAFSEENLSLRKKPKHPVFSILRVHAMVITNSSLGLSPADCFPVGRIDPQSKVLGARRSRVFVKDFLCSHLPSFAVRIMWRPHPTPLLHQFYCGECVRSKPQAQTLWKCWSSVTK